MEPEASSRSVEQETQAGEPRAAVRVFQRDAHVLSRSGERGRLKHILLDPESHAITDLVVRHGGREWRVPVSEVAGGEGGSIRLRGEWPQYERAGAFNHDAFHAAGPSLARAVISQGARLSRGTAEQGDELSAGRTQQLELREERLSAVAEAQQAGTLRISRRVLNRIETIEVPVREERLVIERVPGSGSGPIAVGDHQLDDGETVEIVLSTERITVNKEPVALEDVSIWKQTDERQAEVHETVRREEITVEASPGLATEVLAPPAGAAHGT